MDNLKSWLNYAFLMVKKSQNALLCIILKHYVENYFFYTERNFFFLMKSNTFSQNYVLMQVFVCSSSKNSSKNIYF